MVNSSSSSARTKRLVGMGLFTAIIVVLQLVATFVKIGTFPVTLVLIPIVVGAAVYGPKSGAYFGGVFGVVVLIACIFGWYLGGNILWNANPFLTLLLCLVKGMAAGWAAGMVYGAISKKNMYLGVVLAALVCPIVNTGIFCLAMVLFYRDILLQWAAGTSVMYFMIFGLVGVNFLLEVAINVVLCPTVARIIKIEKLTRR